MEELALLAKQVLVDLEVFQDHVKEVVVIVGGGDENQVEAHPDKNWIASFLWVNALMV